MNIKYKIKIMKTKEYRIVCHDMDDLTEEVNFMSKNGWIMFKTFDPEKYNDPSDGKFMRIIWEREGKELPTTIKHE